ncbi:MAG: hypothetical protein N3A63_06445 [Bacteroidetes bacterium]|nr:hypothetical protein [Bacteroidota bacterium]
MKTLYGIIVLFSGVLYAQGKISGLVYWDYFYNVTRDPLTLTNQASPQGGVAYQAFQFRRLYFTYDTKISETFSTRFRLEADQSANASNGTIGVMVKDAYLKWSNVIRGHDCSFGIQPTPALEQSENIWGYRSLEKTVLDLRGIVSSRDLGVSMRGAVLENKKLSYWVLIGNGNSNRPENDKYKRFYLTLLSEPVDGVVTTFYVDYGARPRKMDPYRNILVGNSLQTYALFIGYTMEGFYRVGCEIFQQSVDNDYNTGSSLRTRDAHGVSFFGIVSFTSRLEFVGRYDYFDPNNAKSSRGDSRNFLIAGVGYKIEEKVSVVPNILYETFEKQPSGYSPRAALTLRMTFHYSF